MNTVKINCPKCLFAELEALDWEAISGYQSAFEVLHLGLSELFQLLLAEIMHTVHWTKK